jgi:hypothetical protein
LVTPNWPNVSTMGMKPAFAKPAPGAHHVRLGDADIEVSIRK